MAASILRRDVFRKTEFREIVLFVFMALDVGWKELHTRAEIANEESPMRHHVAADLTQVVERLR